MGCPKSFKTCEIVQQLRYMSQEQVENGLDHNAVKDYAYILHDKDKNADGTEKLAHWHIMIRFKDSVPTTSICNWFHIQPERIGKIHGRFADALAYLTHSNTPEKEQYLEENVVSNFDFVAEAASVLAKSASRKRKDELIELIQSGVIREYNYTDYITAIEYDRFKKSIDNAFAYRKDALMHMDRNMTCIYIFGESSCGKTTYSKQLAIEKGYSFYVSSGSNDPLDGYRGEDCLILDDVRPEDFNVSDFLKLLDNNTQSTVKSRYRNKMLECQLLILTTSMSMPVFFRRLSGCNTEQIKQFERRCELYVEMTEQTMKTYLYQRKSGKYQYVETYVNPVFTQYLKLDRTKEECVERVKDLLLPERVATNYECGFKDNPPGDVMIKFETWHQEALHLEAKPNTKPTGH